MIALKPALSNDIATMAGHIAQNFIEVVEVCVSTCAMLTTQPSMLRSILDGVTYLRDGCITLCALLRCYKPASGLVVSDGPGMVESLVAIHDNLVPKIQHALISILLSSEEERMLGKKVEERCNHCELVSEKSLEVLIYNAYLVPHTHADHDHQNKYTSSNENASGGSGSASGSSSKRHPSTTTTTTAVARGESLLNALTLLGHRETFSQQHNLPNSGLSIGPALAHRHGIAGAIHAAIQQEIVSLDDVQVEYIAALLDVPSLGGAPGIVPGVDAGELPSALPSHERMSGNQQQQHDGENDIAQLKVYIGRVKDVLSDFGDGFIACCLDVYNNDVENTMNGLLEGSLPGDLGKKDSRMTFEEYLKERKELKEELESQREFPSLPAAATAIANAHHHAVPSTQNALKQTKSANNLTARYLDLKDFSYKAKLQALEAQWEYDDEYDDSFDDLLHVVGADGAAADAEGDEGVETSGNVFDKEQSDGKVGVESLAGSMMSLLRMDGGSNSRGQGSHGSQSRLYQQQQQQQQQKQRGKGSKLWVLDGRIYNYAKEGATEVGSKEQARQKIAEAKQASLEVHGLGPGGNIPLHSVEQESHQVYHRSGGGRGGRGGGRGGQGRGSTGTAHGASSNHSWKSKNKSATGNHHRKDRAAQKASRGMQ